MGHICGIVDHMGPCMPIPGHPLNRRQTPDRSLPACTRARRGARALPAGIHGSAATRLPTDPPVTP